MPVWYAEIIGRIISVETYLRIQGVGEIIVGLLFLVWFSGKWGVRTGIFYAIAEFLFILIFGGVNLITFRDIGLLGAALSFLIISYSHPPAKET